MKAKYRLYAGYYEAIITTRVLRQPYTHVSNHFTLGNAIRAAERMDPEALVFDEDLKEEAAAHFFGEPFLPEDLDKITTFEGAKKEIALGLTDYTLYGLAKRLPCKVEGLDLRDVANYISLKAKITKRKAFGMVLGKTYGEVKDLLAPWVPESEYKKVS